VTIKTKPCWMAYSHICPRCGVEPGNLGRSYCRECSSKMVYLPDFGVLHSVGIVWGEEIVEEDLRTVVEWDVCRNCKQPVARLTNGIWVHRERKYEGNSLPQDQLCEGLMHAASPQYRRLAYPSRGVAVVDKEQTT